MPDGWNPRWTLPLLLLGLAGCDQLKAKEKTETAKPAPAAKVEKLPGEADLTRVTLSPEAEQRLGIATAAIERKQVPRARMVNGEIMIPPGQAITVSAPQGGTLQAPEGGLPEPGRHIKKDQVVFKIVPLVSPDAQLTLQTQRVDVQGRVNQAQKNFEQAKILLERTEKLRREQLTGAAALVDAKAQYNLAKATLEAEQARLEALEHTIKGLEGGNLQPLPIRSRVDGVLKNLHARDGEVVAQGAMLFDVVDLNKVWVRVPTYVGELPRVATDQPAEIGNLAEEPDAPKRQAQPVPAPPTGDPLAAAVDLYYEVDNHDGLYRPGQRVGVNLPLKGEREALVVPRAAVLRDYDGGAWVYVALGNHTFSRRRVRLETIMGSQAILAAGPAPGTPVVTDGAAELFGIEIGGLK
jgi:cobalt-zinc-cadmium efflux system membrane fusion protein